ncbi:hypothetical protein [Streptomyces sp. H27-D2]|uniref:hypothetical protein n=1 Tax=Streptomyces sp. H27-D2 TaxID=3046304 RepID=UPI002DB6A5CB|nr:hypothetical protein [Streptomyces sp. H27-D2]MEC4019170.1 hypothetical protein [Streptomyces sp. H27-D2]
MPSKDAKHLAREAESLKTFKGRVDTMLAELEGSKASHGNIGHQKVSRASYGSGFAEADDLAALYEKVHAQLETLSKTFGDQIEAMGIAVQMADKGYTGADEEQAERLRAIQRRTRKHYEPPLKPAEHAPGTAQPTPGTSASTGDNDF